MGRATVVRGRTEVAKALRAPGVARGTGVAKAGNAMIARYQSIEMRSTWGASGAGVSVQSNLRATIAVRCDQKNLMNLEGDSECGFFLPSPAEASVQNL